MGHFGVLVSIAVAAKIKTKELRMKPVSIPRRIDEPPHLLLWTADEFAPMLLGLVIGIVIAKPLPCFLLGLLVTNLYRRFKDNHPEGYLLHLGYWAGLMPSKAKTFKNPYARRFLP